ncbi:hypothetical protein HU200_037399 [Digitaria exilis]|uniref:Dirigent protein n=1 Tax=Digitaria exilis TaxID=1010633 RepID=A0A835EMS7_9POAL|nr:hypothetical protein HU200_037399 [Digitaria exilis]
MSPTSSLTTALFLVASLVAVAVAMADDGTTHLHFFMHDTVTGSDPTAVQVIKGNGSSVVPGLAFGDTIVIDDALTTTTSASSSAAVVGRAQGYYMVSSTSAPAVLAVCANLLLTMGEFNGSTVEAASMNGPDVYVKTSNSSSSTDCVGGCGVNAGVRRMGGAGAAGWVNAWMPMTKQANGGLWLADYYLILITPPPTPLSLSIKRLSVADRSAAHHKQATIPSTMATHTVLLLALLAAMATAATADDNATTHLSFFMHDIVSGTNPTAVKVIKGPGSITATTLGMAFGDTTVVDDALTETSSATSAALGRMQGIYMLSSQTGAVLMVCANLLLTSGDHNGSTIQVFGRDDTDADVRELAVVGGTGSYRMATGYVLWKTSSMSGADATVKLDVYLTTGNGTTVDADAPVSSVDGGGSSGGGGSSSGSKASSGAAARTGGGWVSAVAAVVAVVGSWWVC